MAVLISNPAEGESRLFISSTLSFLARYEEKRDDILDCTATGDETSVFHHTPEKKRQ
jgi:hypothetical protein